MKTVKFLSMLIAVAMFGFSCSSGSDDSGNPGGGESGKLTLSVSTSLIQADGTDAAQLSVFYDDKPVTEGVDIYDAVTNKIVDLPSLRFTTSTVGKYSFWASYKTEKSNVVNVESIDQPIPELPADPNPQSTDFKRRVMLTLFTGTRCQFCPFMLSLLDKVLAKPEYASTIVHTAAHTFPGDPISPSNAASLDQAFSISGWPMVVTDMHTVFKNYNSQSSFESTLNAELARSEAKAGIAVNSVLSGNTLVVRVSVKAAVTDVFRVGAWLLENGIEVKQYNPSNVPGEFDTHNDCVRLTDSQFSKNNYTGLFLGSINKGEVVDHIFSMGLKDGWVKENCHLAVFVTTAEGNSFYVNNVVDVPIGEELAYDYK